MEVDCSISLKWIFKKLGGSVYWIDVDQGKDISGLSCTGLV